RLPLRIGPVRRVGDRKHHRDDERQGEADDRSADDDAEPGRSALSPETAHASTPTATGRPVGTTSTSASSPEVDVRTRLVMNKKRPSATRPPPAIRIR